MSHEADAADNEVEDEAPVVASSWGNFNSSFNIINFWNF